MLFQARLTLAFIGVLNACPFALAGAAAAVPTHRVASGPRATLEHQPAARPTPALAPHRPEAEHSPSPPFWNPLKRKRMAMPAPPAADGTYAF